MGGPPMGGANAGQALAPYGGQPPAGPMMGTLKSEAPGASGPTRRNALMTFLLPVAVIFGGTVLGTILAYITPSLYAIGSLISLGGVVWSILLAVKMIGELKVVTRNEVLAWWPLIVPVYNLYFMWLVVPQEVAKAKQVLGVRQPPQPIVLYVFLWHFALASDLNDMVR
jgi:hypothetical protein